MNNLKSILKKFDVKLNSCKYLGKVKILETDKGNFVYKENSNNYDIYEYLKTHNFNYVPKILNQKNDSYELLEYIKEYDISKEEKVKDLIHLSGILHRQTSYNKEIDLDLIKEEYETILNKANYLMNYYIDLNNYLDTITFMSPSEYLLVSNIDIIYYLLNFVKVEINNWYNFIKNEKTIRYSMIHNNLSINHILEGDNKYLISWGKAKQDMPILDLIKIYEENYYDYNLEDLLNEYEHENRLNRYEYLLFLIKIAIPKRIEFTKDTYLDCYKINNYLVYLSKIATLVQKNELKNKKV